MSQAKVNRAIVNIGGITNVTLLPAKGKVLGWDIGPGNCLIDQAMKNITNGKSNLITRDSWLRKEILKY